MGPTRSDDDRDTAGEPPLDVAGGDAPARPSSRRFVMRRLHGLSGVVPLAVFVIAHLSWQSSALDGPLAHEHAMSSTPWLDGHPLVVVALVLVPLLLHALYGLVLAARSRPNVGTYTGGLNWRHVAQRVSGLLTLIFVAVHLRQTWVARQLGEISPADGYGVLVELLSSTSGGLPWWAVFYLVGMAAVSFHLASGLWGFCCSWGLTVTRASRRRSAIVFGLLGCAVFAQGVNLSLYLATGVRLVERGGRSVPQPCHELRSEVLA